MNPLKILHKLPLRWREKLFNFFYPIGTALLKLIIRHETNQQNKRKA